MESVRAYEERLDGYTLDRMNGLSMTAVVGPRDPSVRSGVISFNVEGLDSHETAMLLDSNGIMVRSGLHCAQPLHELLGISTTARASFYIYNTLEEIDRFIDVMSEIESVA
jgi:cysteine desulfurase/selenocysteine lyase